MEGVYWQENGEILQKIYETGIIPVIAIEDAALAVPLAKALLRGGLPVAEITFRTDAAKEAIRLVRQEVPQMLVGAGTVLTKEQADQAIAAGAKFIVSPGFHREIAQYVKDQGILMMPGTATPGEMEQAMAMGLSIVKFFPAEQNGGLSMLRALAGPYQELYFMPTGGISEKNVAEYLSFPKVLACGGTWMVKKELIAAQAWDEIERLARRAVSLMLGFSVGKISIYEDDGGQALASAQLLQHLFGFDTQETATEISINGAGGQRLSVGKIRTHGAKGCICIETNTLPRAAAYLRKKGVQFQEETRTKSSVYLAEQVGGFELCLVQRS